MTTLVLTSLEPDLSLEGRLKGGAEAIGWEYDGLEFRNPQKINIPLKHRIPISVSNPEKALEKLRAQLRKRYTAEICALEEKKEKTKPSTKKYKAISEKIAMLESFLKNDGIEIQNDHFITPPLSKRDRAILSPESPHNTPSAQYRMQTGFPYSLVHVDGDEVTLTGQRPDLEHLVSAPGVAIDFETHNWQKDELYDQLKHFDKPELLRRFRELADAYKTPYTEETLSWMSERDLIRGMEKILDKNQDEKITAASFIDLKTGQNYVITTIDPGVDTISVDIPGDNQKANVRVLLVDNQEQLIEKLNDLFEDIQPLFVYGHNQMKFDYAKAKELTGVFRPGVTEEEPKHVSQDPSGFIKQIITPGRIDIDPSGYAMHYMSLYNNKLDTVFKELFDIISKKTMTHDELAVKTARAEAGSTQDSWDILFYAAQDSMKSYLIGERLKREHLQLSYAMNSPASRIDTVSKKGVAVENWSRDVYKRKGKFNSIVSMETRFDGKTVRDRDLDKQWLGKVRAIKGIHHGHLIECYPFAKIFESLIKSRDSWRALYDAVRSTEDPREKSRLLTGIEALTQFPALCRAYYPKDFEQIFGEPLEKYDERAKTHLKKLEELLNNLGVINVSRNAFVTEDFDDEIRRYGVHIGEGTFISGNKGVFAGRIGDQFLMRGIADYNSNKGQRCTFEKQVYKNFFEAVLFNGDIDRVVKDILDIEGRLHEHIPELRFSRTMARASKEYSANARGRAVQEARNRDLEKGDRLEYWYGAEDLRQKLFARGGTISRLFPWASRQSPFDSSGYIKDRNQLLLFEDKPTPSTHL